MVRAQAVRLLIAILAIACASPDASTQTRDWPVAARWTAGTLGSGVEFQDITKVTAMPGNQLAVVDRKAFKATILDSLGHRSTEFGRNGSGPGEIDGPSAIGVVHDTLWLSDQSLRRLTMFTLQGRVLATIPLTQALAKETIFSAGTVTGILADGSLVSGVAPAVSTRKKAGDLDRRAPIFRAGSDGVFHDTMFTFRRGAWTLRPKPGAFIHYQPMSDGDLWRVDPDGRHIVLITPTAAVSPAPSTFRITLIPPVGARSFTDAPYTPIPVSKAVADSVLRGAMKIVARMHDAATISEDDVRNDLFLPRYFAPVTDLVIDANGSLWLRREATGAPTSTWELTTTVGVRTGSIRLPAAERIVAARFPLVWVSASGRDGEPLIRLYSVTP